MKVNLLKDNITRMFFLLLASAIGSTIVMSIYSSVDMICVGQYTGPDGSAAISCMNPLWSIMISPGILAGVGGAVMMGNRKGAGDDRAANEYFSTGTGLALLFSVIIFLSMVIFPEELLTFFGAEDEAVLRLSVDYMRSIAIVSPAFTMCATLSTYMRNDGEAIIPTVATVIGGVINIVLDILFVFDFGLGLGIAGAGIATATGQVVAFAIILSYFFTKKCTLRLVKPTKLFGKLARIVTLGFSAFIVDLSFGITSTVFNKSIIEALDKNHLAVYGTASMVLVTCYTLFNGIGTALQPIVAANFGADRRDRVRSAMRLGLACSVAFGIVMTLATQLLPGIILRLSMDVTDEVMAIGPQILRIYTAALLLTGIPIVATYYFQSVLRQGLSTVLALLRGLVLPVAFAVLLPLAFGINTIWWAIPLTELVSAVIAGISLLVTERKGKEKQE